MGSVRSGALAGCPLDCTNGHRNTGPNPGVRHFKILSFSFHVCLGGGIALVLIVWVLLVSFSDGNSGAPGVWACVDPSLT